MPQMAPSNWFMMFLMFNLINLFIISINYYIFTPKMNLNLKFKFINKFNFLW